MKEWSILEVMPLGIVVIDRSFSVQGWNRWMEMYSGIDAVEIEDESLFRFFPELNRPSFLRACRAVFTFGNVVYLSQKLHRYLFPFRLYGGQEEVGLEMMQQSCSMSPIRQDDEIQAIAITVQDVTDSVVLERKLRQMNQIDGLTGAYNRRFFDLRLHEEVARHERYGRKLSLIMLDIDHFKKTNDEHGHLEGDRVLRGLVDTIHRELRESDIFCRYGGEEFTVILPETDIESAEQIAERMRTAVSECTFGSDRSFRVTASFGIASLGGEQKGLEDLIAAADRQLYRAKREGRNRVCSISKEG